MADLPFVPTGCDCDACDGDHSSRCAIYVQPAPVAGRVSSPAEHDQGTCIHCGKRVTYNPSRGWEHGDYSRFCRDADTKGETTPARTSSPTPDPEVQQ